VNVSAEIRDEALKGAIIAIALPAMLTNIATAAFGLADMWVIGRLGDPASQGGVEIGSKLLLTILAVFGFLRSSTVALTAQAIGRGEESSQAAVLVRAFAVAAAIGALLILAKPLAVPIGLRAFGAQGRVEETAHAYVAIRYWSGIPWLLSAVLTGWLVGRKRVRQVLAIEVATNVFHICFDVALVLEFHLGVAGVAYATLISEITKFAALATFATHEAPFRGALHTLRNSRTWEVLEIGGLLRLNRDLFGRTVLLMVVIAVQTRTGAEQGAVILAANAILYQLFILSSLMLDGFESAAQVLCGEALGAKDRRRFDRLVRALLVLGGIAAVTIAAIYALAGSRLATSFSTAPDVITAVRIYLPWAMLFPLAGITSFVLDGVFIGANWTRALLVTMAASLAGYTALLWLGRPIGNHGLWLAFTLFFILRAVGQIALIRQLTQRTFSRSLVTA
jgi:MATE family multidrug resistance protein